MSTPDSPGEVDAQCLQIATSMIERYGWRLLGAAQLAELMRARLEGHDQADLKRYAISEYCCVLHAAAAGAEGPVRQNRAYEELARFLAGVARHRYAWVSSDQLDDVLQSCLERVFRSFHTCREPRAFLAFAAYRLLDAVREAQRQDQSAGSLQRSVGLEGRVLELEDPQQLAADAGLLADERRAGIERFLQLYLQAHPLAARQVAVQRLSLLAELENEAIAGRLGIPLGSVYVARSRFSSTVRREPQWRKLAQELGILPDEP